MTGMCRNSRILQQTMSRNSWNIFVAAQ